MKRTITALLLIAMLLGTIASCGEKTPTESTQNPTADTETESVETETEEETELQPDIPKLDFGGETFTCLTSGESDDNGVDWVTYDVWVESLTGDAINDAVYNRNAYLMETYNITLQEIQSTGTTQSQTKKDVQSGSGEYDLVFTNITAGCNLAQDGNLLSLYTLPYIDLAKPWWDQKAVKDLSLLGSLYFATGDITVIDNDATWVLMFNKEMHKDHGFDDLYDLVRENKWYYDTFYGMIQTAAVDTNGDGKMYGPDDTFGFATSDYSSYGLLYASGEQFTARDAEDKPVLVSDHERMSRVAEAAAKIMADKERTVITGKQGISDSDNLRFVFEEGRSLFFGEVMQCITRMRDSETAFGLIPWPKFDEGQKDFCTLIHTTAGKGIVIPASQNNMELAGAITEAMAAKSMYTLTPAYYNVALTYKYMRDNESAEMLDIILESRCFDLGLIYAWGGLSSGIHSIITNGKAENFASTWEKNATKFDTALDKTMTAYEELKNR